MSSFTDAFAKATEPYAGYDYYLSGNKWFNPAESAALAEKLNVAFAWNITPQEITRGVWDFGNRRRAQFSFNPATDEHTQWDAFTPSLDPFTLARESIASVLKFRGHSEQWIHDNFFKPLIPAIEKGAAWEVAARESMSARQKAEYEAAHPSFDTGWGAVIGGLASNPVVQIAAAAVGAYQSGLFSLGADAAGGIGAELAAADYAAGLVPEYGTVTASPITAADTLKAITDLPTTGVKNMSFSVDEYGVLDVNDLAAQDYADFGVQGVQDLGDSLNYSNGLDWVSNTVNASNPAAVNDIFGSIGNAIKGVGNVIKAAAGAVASTRTAVTAANRVQPNYTAVTAANRVQPNYTAAAGSVNVGLLALGAAAFFALKG